jgi:hypothetical protein
MMGMMQRLMIQADKELIDRARQRAAERETSIAQVVRDALEHELGPVRPVKTSIIGIIDLEGANLSERASNDEYEPPPWRSS